MATRQPRSTCPSAGPTRRGLSIHPSRSLIYVVGVASCHTPAAGAGLSLPFPSLSPTLLHTSPNNSRTLQETEQDQQHLDQDQGMDSSEHKVIGIGVVVPEERRPFCVECRTTATPMWRGGPTGPRSLCNACGIRYRKKRRQELGLDNKQQQKTQQKQQQQQQLLLLGQPQPPQRQPQPQHLQQDLNEATSTVKDSNSSSNKSSSLQVVKKRRVLMGVEEAAILLMALSSSSRSPTLLHG